MIADELDRLDPEQLRDAWRAARAEVAQQDELLHRREREVAFKQAIIDKLTHKNAILKRLKFAASNEAFNAEQKSLLEETLDGDLAAVAADIEVLGSSKPQGDKQQARRQPLSAHLPRREIHHEPEDTTCGCGRPMQRIGEDVAENLDYQPGSFTVERHVRGKWVGECGVQLLPMVDALRAELRCHGLLHADETPVAMLKPGHGKTHRAYLWSYCTTSLNPIKPVVFDFADSRGGQHVRGFLRLPGTEQNPGWKGRLVTDDFSGYKACFELGATEVGCMAHARRKFHELRANHGSPIGELALKLFVQLYDVERDLAEAESDARVEARRR